MILRIIFRAPSNKFKKMATPSQLPRKPLRVKLTPRMLSAYLRYMMGQLRHRVLAMMGAKAMANPAEIRHILKRILANSLNLEIRHIPMRKPVSSLKRTKNLPGGSAALTGWSIKHQMLRTLLAALPI
jgi:hypothetical protein